MRESNARPLVPETKFMYFHVFTWLSYVIEIPILSDNPFLS